MAQISKVGCFFVPLLQFKLKLLMYSCCLEWAGQAGQPFPVMSCPVTRRNKFMDVLATSPTFTIEEQTNPQVACAKKPEMDKNNSMTNAGKTYKGAEARHSWDSLTARSTRKGWAGKKQGFRFLPSRLRPCPSQIIPSSSQDFTVTLWSHKVRCTETTSAPHPESAPPCVGQSHAGWRKCTAAAHHCSATNNTPLWPENRSLNGSLNNLTHLIG